MNKLPEKLSLLRKYNQMSQADIAARLNVPLRDYMSWENGNTICSIMQLKQLADLLGVTVDSLVDNTKIIVIPEEDLAQSAQIPFQNGQNINQTQSLDSADALEQTVDMNATDGDMGETKVVDSQNLYDEEEPTEEEEVEEEDEEEKKDTPKVRKKKIPDPKRKKKSMLMIGSAVAVVVAIVVILIALKGSFRVALGTENRLALGDSFSLYVDKNSTVKVRGSFDTESNFSKAVQVSAFGTNAAALTEDGNVITAKKDKDASAWKNISYIAAGANHVAGVTSEGKAVCSGSEEACKVDSWSNLKSIYAGNEITIGVTNDGETRVSGNNAQAANNQTNVSHVSMSDNIIALVKNDGTVVTFIIGSASPLNTSGWSNIEQVAAGNNFAAGLKADGTVEFAGTNADLAEAVAGWKNVRYIAAQGDTLIAIDRSGGMYGAGPNDYHQYESKSEENDADTDDEKEKSTLKEPSNITVSETTANVVIKWNSVKNASSYVVSVSGLNALPETSTNQVSIPTSELTNGQSYTITVTAKPSDTDKYEESSASITYTFTAKTVQLGTPSGITAKTTNNGWEINWTPVDHADYYMITLDGNPLQDQITSASYTFDSSNTITVGNHTITVKAYSNNTTYTESEAGSGTVQYQPATKKVSITYVKGDSEFSGTSEANVAIGLDYSFADLDRLAGGYAGQQGYTLSDPTGKTHIDDSTTSVVIYVK